ncbi:hypothetical protein [Streptomyces mirabilis]|uniref:hypothetical protein n=1 Tax=Streptomyces mirabilis TaxID=68239 RepID=UPI0036461719
MTTTPRPIRDLDVPLTDVERQIAELRAHAAKHLAERGETATGQLIDQWHEFLDIDPDLRGRDYTQPKGAS